MATEAQIAANRRNSQKSTGPKTADGKAVVAQNALKHGLFATLVVINGETQEDFDMFRGEMLAELVPVGIIESVLAERIVSLAWRLRRAEVMERQVIDELIDCNADRHRSYYGSPSSDPRKSPDYLPLGRIATRDWSNSRIIERVLMYERRIEYSIFKVMAELKSLQQIRENEQAAAEAEQAIPINVNRNEAATRTQEAKRSNYEKQSQSQDGLKNVKPYSQNDYENKSNCEHGGNKANSKPISAPERGRNPAPLSGRDRLVGASVSVRRY